MNSIKNSWNATLFIYSKPYFFTNSNIIELLNYKYDLDGGNMFGYRLGYFFKYYIFILSLVFPNK